MSLFVEPEIVDAGRRRAAIARLREAKVTLPTWSELASIAVIASRPAETSSIPVPSSMRTGSRTLSLPEIGAATKLAELAKAGDADAVAAQVKVVGDACAACHKDYRAR